MPEQCICVYTHTAALMCHSSQDLPTIPSQPKSFNYDIKYYSRDQRRNPYITPYSELIEKNFDHIAEKDKYLVDVQEVPSDQYLPGSPGNKVGLSMQNWVSLNLLS